MVFKEDKRLIQKDKVKRPFERAFLYCVYIELTLAELWTLTCFMQTHFLTFNLTRITGYKTGFA